MDFMIVGVARCGTTSLYHYLKQHPQIGLPDQKEPKYYSSKFKSYPHNGPGDYLVDEETIKSEFEYNQLFNELNNKVVIGEASSDYFYFHEKVIPDLINIYGSSLKIIICIRNPLERCYSAYSNLIRDSREQLNFREALGAESKRIKDNFDWMWHYKSGSLYSFGIENFQKNFQNVLIITNDELKNDPQKTLKNIFNFLNVSNNYLPNTKIKYSPSGRPKNLLIKLITSRTNILSGLRKFIMSNVSREFLENISKNFFKKNDIDEDIMLDLKRYFRNDIEKTENLINKDLSSWK